MLHDLCKDRDNAATIHEYLSTVAAEQPDDLSYVVNLKDDQRYTPLHSAIFCRNIEAIKILVQYGADVDLKCHGIPPLQLALSTAVQPGGQQFGYECFCFLLAHDANASCKDDRGFTVVHLAAEYNLPDFISEVLKHIEDIDGLLNATSKVSGITALHRAAMSDADLSARVLLQSGADASVQSGSLKMTALHMAGEMGAIRVWKEVVRSYPDMSVALSAIGTCSDGLGRSAKDVAESSGWLVDSNDSSVLVPTEALKEQLLDSSASCKTAIISNPLSVRHHSCPPSTVTLQTAPPENTRRIEVLVDDQMGVLGSSDLKSNLTYVKESKLAVISDILRVHEWSYVRKVQEFCASIESSDPEDADGLLQLDGDTTVSRDSYLAAVAAAGAVCEGVDMVMNRKAGNAFCAVRPPGHHAGPKGIVNGHGFCIFNNVSVGASYAMNVYRDSVQRVAIVDFDVHHGNGTEETVRWLQPTVDAFDLSQSGSDLFGVFHMPKYKPWFSEHDAENVLFVSVHGYGPRERGLEDLMPHAAFYPGSGKTSIPRVPPSPRHKAIPTPSGCSLESHLDPVEVVIDNNSTKLVKVLHDVVDDDDDSDDDGDYDDDEESASNDHYALEQLMSDPSSSRSLYTQVFHKKRMYSTLLNKAGYRELSTSRERGMAPLILDIGVGLPAEEASDRLGKVLSEYAYRIQWRKYFREEIFPRLMTFCPDFLFISAGFDAHRKDSINQGYIALTEEDFEWVTHNLVKIANTCCGGRIVSVLEGGYQLGGEYCSAFAQSAKAHVRSLSLNSSCRSLFSIADCQAETKLEEAHLEELEKQREQLILRKEQSVKLKQLQSLLQQEQQAVTAEQLHTDHISAAGETSVEEKETTSSFISCELEVKDETTGRKRRRPQVDYAALDKELREDRQSK